jgi:autotransporter-associated beta strand protein
VTLQGTDTFNIAGTSLTLSNSVGGPGSLVKTGAGTLYCAATNRYSGSTLLNTGMLALIGSGGISGSSNIAIATGATLSAAGRSDGKLTLAAGQALGGNGTILGGLTVGIGAMVAPGTSAGVVRTLTVTNAVTLQGTTCMKLNQSGATNDVLQSGAGIMCGGTLSLTNLGGTLAAGNSFKLFSGTSYSGVFTNFAPAMPGPGLAWDPAGLTNGTLRIVAAPKPVIAGISQSGFNLTFTGTNGIANATYYLLASTNLAVPLANWTRVATNVFDGSGQFTYTNGMAPNLPQQFYRVLLGP